MKVTSKLLGFHTNGPAVNFIMSGDNNSIKYNVHIIMSCLLVLLTYYTKVKGLVGEEGLRNT